MQQITAQPDKTAKATEADKITALASLAALPSRAANSEAFDRGAYYVALEGVTRYSLAQAVRSILQGSLNHAFFPSPPELRMECNRVMEAHWDEMAKKVRAERLRAERPDDFTPPSAEAKARAAKLYAEFCKAYEPIPGSEPMKLDPELVAQVPDNPNSPARKRMGVRVQE